jgi:RNase H-fold protein (predicted Holliday junction resolvase)
MSEVSILAIDVGRRRSGFAFSESGIVGRPAGTVEHTNEMPLAVARDLLPKIQQYKPDICLLGYPIMADGSSTAQSLWTDLVASALTHLSPHLFIDLVPETGSTRDAALEFTSLPSDEGAAMILLHDFLAGHPLPHESSDGYGDL